MEYEYFQRYANLLDEGELLALFDIVKSEAGSISKTARKCGMQRKTIYDMINEGKQVRESTKKRILKASLRANFEKSLELLLTKATEETREILFNYFSLIYEKAMQTEDRVVFNELVSRFESIVDRYSPIVAGELQKEVTGLLHELASQSARLGMPHDLPALRVMDSDSLAAVVPGLIRDLMIGTDGLMNVAKKWRMQPSLVASLSDTMDNLFDLTAGTAIQKGIHEGTNMTPDALLGRITHLSRNSAPVAIGVTMNSADNEHTLPHTLSIVVV